MADGNTQDPKVILPFGGSTAEGPKNLFIQRPEGGSAFLSQSESGAAVTDITNLVGAQVYERLNIRGEIGYREGQFTDSSRDVNMTRQPWVLTCQQWLQEGRYIIARVNPKEVGWRMPQRSVAQKTRVGEVLHVWRDRFRGTFYDEPQLSIAFQSGNIMPIRSKPLIKDTSRRRQVGESPDYSGKGYVQSRIEGAQAGFQQGQQEVNQKINDGVNNFVGAEGGPTGATRWKNDPSETEPTVPEGLANFYEFLALVDEQKILDNGDINYVYIVYNSRIFPNLTLAGLFTPDGATWSDSSDGPNEVNGWSANFTVYDSFPRLHDYGALERAFRSSGFGRV